MVISYLTYVTLQSYCYQLTSTLQSSDIGRNSDKHASLFHSALKRINLKTGLFFSNEQIKKAAMSHHVGARKGIELGQMTNPGTSFQI
jgi:hypothetical protein